jgi:preprotein translocase subunit SecE
MDNVGGVDQPKRIVAIFYALAALAAGMFLEKVLEVSFGAAGINDFTVVGDWTLSTVLGFVLAVVAAVVVWRVPKTQQVSMEIALELRRVTWPSMRETRASTIAVIIASFVAAAILGVFDLVWSFISARVY